MRPFLILCGALAVLISGWLFGTTVIKGWAALPAEQATVEPFPVFLRAGTAQTSDSKSRVCPTRNFAQEYTIKYLESATRIDRDERNGWAIGLGLAFVADALVWCR